MERHYLLIFRADQAAGALEASAQRRRLDWLDELRSAGTLIMSGPSADRSTSILLVNAGDPAEVERIIRSDPSRDARWTSVEAIEWEIHTGRPSTSG